MDRNFLRVSPDMDLSSAMSLLSPSGTCALVMEGGRLLGLLTTENLSEFILLRQVGLRRTKVET
jgi:hypothetical protein